jgi:hypothetical protein
MFLPATMLSIKDKRHPEFDQEIYDIFGEGRISPVSVRTSPEYSKYKHLVEDVINVQFESFYTNTLDVYKVIEHKNEVLDLLLMQSIDTANTDISGNLMKIKNLIEVE